LGRAPTGQFARPEELMALVDSFANEDVHPRSSSKLKILCVGTGRDGTLSLNHIIQHVFTAFGSQQSMHEYCAREIYQAFCDFHETDDNRYEDALRRMISECPYDSIVGNGYAAILPLFAEQCGRGLKLVHLIRADRQACVTSLIKNCEMFPKAYGYYSHSPSAAVKRMAAFHFCEMSRSEWDPLSLKEKFGWYYDKTHALVGQHRRLFDEYIEIETETLNDDVTRQKIADFVQGSGSTQTPPKTHLNASVIDISSFPKQQQTKMNWLMGRLNLEEMAQDDVYALDFFLEKFIAWTGYQIKEPSQLDGAPRSSREKIAADLERAAKIVGDRLRDIDELYKLVCDPSDKAAE
jgi:hypothetical protein